MLQPVLACNEKELEQIIQLQRKNLAINIDEKEIYSEGFVTIQHDLATLNLMHQLAPSVIIKEDEKVIGYALTMLRDCRQLIPDLEPMFALFDNLSWKAKPLNEHRFYVMGQICIDKAYRGRGLVNALYQFHKRSYQHKYDLLITEIAMRNQRSIRAHEKAGFETIHVYRDQLDEWAVVVWDWRQAKG